jgi:uncharacterized YigZ family protein
LFTINTTGVAEQTINKSRFIAYAQSVLSEREIAAFFRAIASQNPTAHHLAYAYRIKTADGIVPRFSDAGEPSGTAGKPILQMLDGQNLVNIAIAVIRYYGGVNLGTGGLARAYGGTAKLALQQCQTVPYVEMQTIKMTIEYNQLDHLTVFICQKSGLILDKQFDALVHVQVSLPKTEVPHLLQKFNQIY